MTIEYEKRSGVRILLSPDTGIPYWVRSKQGVRVKAVDIQGKSLLQVEIDRGEAEFIGGGSVALRIDRQKISRVGFEPNEVLEIQTPDGELIKRNHLMCVKCMANTGKMISYRPGEFAGKVDAIFQCGQNPAHQWELQNI